MIYMDATNYAVKVVLLQHLDDGNATLQESFGYWYKTLSKEEKNYSAMEKEYHAVMREIIALRTYI